MERAFRVVAAGLIAMFILLAWAIVAIPGSLLVKLILFFVLTASAFGITLVMTTESPVADAVLRPPWADEAAGGPAPSDDDGAGAPAAKPVRARARRAAEEGGDGEPVGAPEARRAQGDEAPGS